MAKVYISEYASSLHGSAAQEPASTEQNVAIGGTSVQSSAFANNTRLIRVHTDAICSIAIGSNPTAVATAKRLAANQTEYFAVSPAYKLAVITNT